MANLLQDQYSSVFSDPNSKKKRQPQIHKAHEEILDDISFTEEDIIKAISEIGTYSSCGENDIPAIVLKSCKDELSYPIWKMWRESLDTGEIPPDLKFQLITPVHKKGSKAIPSNYRPISLTSHLIKIFERVLRTKIVAYLERNKIICRNQHGFRRGRSCLTQLLYHVDLILLKFQTAMILIPSTLIMPRPSIRSTTVYSYKNSTPMESGENSLPGCQTT